MILHGKTPWKVPDVIFQESEGSCQGIFQHDRKDPSNPSRGSFQGSFRRTSLTVHSVYDSISKKQFADILKHMDGNQRKWKILFGFKLISYVLLLLFNIVIIKSGKKFENVALDLRVKSLQRHLNLAWFLELTHIKIIRSFENLMPRQASICANKNIVSLLQCLAHIATAHNHTNGTFAWHNWDTSGGGKFLAQLLRKV